MALRKINIEGIKLYAYHGCLEEEGKIGANYIVDVYMDYNFESASKSDNLEETIDYCAIYEIAKKEMAVRSKLIEEVGQRIFDSVKSQFKLQKLHVKVTKLLPPMNGNVQQVSIEIIDSFAN